MGEIMARVSMLLMAALAISIPCLEANIGDFDDFLRARAMEARRAALQTYHPNPLNVTSELNWHTHLALERHNSSKGRGLREKKTKKGPCRATNPIDQCWRCAPNWAEDRFRLASCGLGFGKNARGGLGGQIYVVKDNSDDDMINPKPGTLRWGVIQKEPLWIIFERNMVIKLQQELMVASDKTIDGRGANVQIKGGGGVTLQFVNNVIIHNLRIRNIKPKPGGKIRDHVDHLAIRTQSDGDAISLFGATNIWIDHVSLAEAEDGLIDAVMGSTGITISNCHMTKHNDVMLFGSGEQYDGDKIMQITVAYNHFGNGLIQRMPRCRYGWYHVVNNDYTHWIMYAIGGSSAPVILSQGNRFIAPNQDAAKQVTNRVDTPETVWRAWQWQSQNDLLENGAIFISSGPPIVPPFKRDLIMEPRPGTQAQLLSEQSGRLSCKIGKPC